MHSAYFDLEAKIKIAKALDEFGVDYIELTSPAASEQSRRDCEAICKLGLKAKVSDIAFRLQGTLTYNFKILTHVRCNMEDAKIAVQTGVDGLDVVIGTSSYLREHSHGKDMTYIKNAALEASLLDTKRMLWQKGRFMFAKTKDLFAHGACCSRSCQDIRGVKFTFLGPR